MTKFIALFLEYILLVIGWGFLCAMYLTVFVNNQLFRTEEYIYKMHTSLKGR